MIGRDVALKGVLAAHATRTEIRSRFIREARVQGQLEHPAIVPVYDFGTDAEGQPFFTMKRVRGVTLERVLDALRRGDEATARLYTRHKLLGAFVQVCLAIDFAHERGVLHRDLKPANVMLGGYGEVYVLDWGLAKVRSASRSFESAPLTRAAKSEPTASHEEPVADVKSAPTAVGIVLGTPGYMAPEQVKGEPVDLRTDIYLLGGILFEILTLEPLHGGGTIAGMMKRALEGVEARASVRAASREVPPELEELVVRACALDPSQRPASARELATGIDAYLSGDRDTELRKALAESHLERARKASERALAPGAPNTARTEALQEVGRAMALDPGDERALKLLVAMLTEPPKEPPREVLEAVESSRLDAQRRVLPRVALFYFVSWIVFVPVQAYMGVLDGKLLVLPIVAWTVAALAVLFAYRFFTAVQPYIALLMVLGAIGIGVSSVIFGPLLLLPTMVVMSTMGTILVTRRDRRVFLMVCNGLALMVPTLLAWLGKHPVSHVVDGDRTLRIGFAAFRITQDGAFGILAASHVALFVMGAIFAARYRDALTAAETKSMLQAWQLRQLVSSEPTRSAET
jgi:eukaryotic-like serine/threonine-protein kinase